MPENESKEDKHAKEKKSNQINVKALIVVLILIASVGASLYFWQEAQDAKSTTPDAIASKNQEESSQIIGQLSSIILIQTESDPTVARVENPETLKAANPDFYADVQEGDYLVLYPQRAIIYRAPENKIINIAPIIDASRLNNEASTAVPEGSSETEQ